MTPELRNCSHCGELYLEMGKGTLCKNCEVMLEEYYREIRRHLQAHQGDTPAEISSSTGIDVRIILSLIRQGRLTF